MFGRQLVHPLDEPDLKVRWYRLVPLGGRFRPTGGKPAAPTVHNAGADRRPRHLGATGSEFTPRHVLEDRDVERRLGDGPLEAGILLLEQLGPLGLVLLQRAVLQAPAVEGLVGDLQLLAGLRNGQTFAVELSASLSLATICSVETFLAGISHVRRS